MPEKQEFYQVDLMVKTKMRIEPIKAADANEAATKARATVFLRCGEAAEITEVIEVKKSENDEYTGC